MLKPLRRQTPAGRCSHNTTNGEPQTIPPAILGKRDRSLSPPCAPPITPLISPPLPKRLKLDQEDLPVPPSSPSPTIRATGEGVVEPGANHTNSPLPPSSPRPTTRVTGIGPKHVPLSIGSTAGLVASIFRPDESSLPILPSNQLAASNQPLAESPRIARKRNRSLSPPHGLPLPLDKSPTIRRVVATPRPPTKRTKLGSADPLSARSSALSLPSLSHQKRFGSTFQHKNRGRSAAVSQETLLARVMQKKITDATLSISESSRDYAVTQAGRTQETALMPGRDIETHDLSQQVFLPSVEEESLSEAARSKNVTDDALDDNISTDIVGNAPDATSVNELEDGHPATISGINEDRNGSAGSSIPLSEIVQTLDISTSTLLTRLDTSIDRRLLVTASQLPVPQLPVLSQTSVPLASLPPVRASQVLSGRVGFSPDAPSPPPLSPTASPITRPVLPTLSGHNVASSTPALFPPSQVPVSVTSSTASPALRVPSSYDQSPMSIPSPSQPSCRPSAGVSSVGVSSSTIATFATSPLSAASPTMQPTLPPSSSLNPPPVLVTSSPFHASRASVGDCSSMTATTTTPPILAASPILHSVLQASSDCNQLPMPVISTLHNHPPLVPCNASGTPPLADFAASLVSAGSPIIQPVLPTSSSPISAPSPSIQPSRAPSFGVSPSTTTTFAASSIPAMYPITQPVLPALSSYDHVPMPVTSPPPIQSPRTPSVGVYVGSSTTAAFATSPTPMASPISQQVLPAVSGHDFSPTPATSPLPIQRPQAPLSGFESSTPPVLSTSAISPMVHPSPSSPYLRPSIMPAYLTPTNRIEQSTPMASSSARPLHPAPSSISGSSEARENRKTHLARAMEHLQRIPEALDIGIPMDDSSDAYGSVNYEAVHGDDRMGVWPDDDDDEPSSSQRKDKGKGKQRFAHASQSRDASETYEHLINNPDAFCTNSALATVLEVVVDLRSVIQTDLKAVIKKTTSDAGDNKKGHRGRTPVTPKTTFQVQHQDQFTVNLQRDVHQLAKELLNLPEDCLSVPTAEELRLYAKKTPDAVGPQLNPFVLDLASKGLASPWNKRAISIFAAEFLSRKDYLCTDRRAIESTFKTYLAALQAKYNKQQKAAATTEAARIAELDDMKMKARYARRTYKRHRRCNALNVYRHVPGVEEMIKELEHFPVDSMSGDETEYGEDGEFLVKTRCTWCSKEADDLFEICDALDLSTRFDSSDRPDKGRFPDIRVASQRPDKRPVPSRLPQNMYTANYKEDLTESEREGLDMRPTFNFFIPTPLLQTAERYRKSTSRKIPPLPRNHPRLALYKEPGTSLL